MRLFRITPYRWIRDTHLLIGLFISPFLLVFAVSTLLFNVIVPREKLDLFHLRPLRFAY